MRRTAVVVALVALAVPASAGVPRLPRVQVLTVGDAAADANGLNSQAGLVPVPAGYLTGVSVASADIVSFSLSRKDDGHRVLALVGTLTLAAPPSPGVDYRIRMSAPHCGIFFLELERSVLGEASYLRHTCATGTTEVSTGGATLLFARSVTVGNSITWTVPLRDLPAPVRLGTVLTVTGAQTSGDAVVIGPGIDEVMTSRTYRIGQ